MCKAISGFVSTMGEIYISDGLISHGDVAQRMVSANISEADLHPFEIDILSPRLSRSIESFIPGENTALIKWAVAWFSDSLTWEFVRMHLRPCTDPSSIPVVRGLLSQKGQSLFDDYRQSIQPLREVTTQAHAEVMQWFYDFKQSLGPKDQPIWDATIESLQAGRRKIGAFLELPLAWETLMLVRFWYSIWYMEEFRIGHWKKNRAQNKTEQAAKKRLAELRVLGQARSLDSHEESELLYLVDLVGPSPNIVHQQWP